MVPKKNGIIVDKGSTEVEDEERPTQVQKRFGKIQKKGSDQKDFRGRDSNTRGRGRYCKQK